MKNKILIHRENFNNTDKRILSEKLDKLKAIKEAELVSLESVFSMSKSGLKYVDYNKSRNQKLRVLKSIEQLKAII